MSHNKFGNLFSYTTWGESHGKAIGAVIDGCPAGIPLDEEDINRALERRAPGKTAFTTPRKETDVAQILSGVFEGVTTGAPISILIKNSDADSSKYEAMKDMLRPGHANFTYLQKYGVFDYRGGGRASARETASRVAAGEVARKMLSQFGIQVAAHLVAVGKVTSASVQDMEKVTAQVAKSSIFVVDEHAEKLMQEAILAAKKEGDSLGGVVEFLATGVPPGLGEPVYEKIDALLAFALMSLPAAKGVEIGEGFHAASLKGSENNDSFIVDEGKIGTASNHAGGSLGGITSGQPLYGRVAFKPTASIQKPMPTVDTHGNEVLFQLPAGSRHDPCVAIRAVPVVEAMCCLVLADALLLQRARALRPSKMLFPNVD